MTDEPAPLIDQWVEKYRPRYPILVVEPDDSFLLSMESEVLPWAMVLDVEGRIVFRGSAYTFHRTVSSELRKARKGPPEPAGLASVIDSFRFGDLESAWSELERARDASSPDSDGFARILAWRRFLEGQAQRAFSKAYQMASDGRVVPAALRLERMAESRVPVARDAAALLEILRSHPRFRYEAEVEAILVRADLALERHDTVRAFELYREAWRARPGTRGGRAGYEQAKRMLEGGRVGWRTACAECVSSSDRSACPRHRMSPELDAGTTSP